MDDDLRQEFAPRRNKRYAHIRSFDKEAEWAKTLDWKGNDYDFYRIGRCIIDRIDSDYREKWGIQVTQLASAEEIQEVFQTCRTWYEEEQVFHARDIYVFLHINLNLWLQGKGCEVLEKRRAIGLTPPSNIE